MLNFRFGDVIDFYFICLFVVDEEREKTGNFGVPFSNVDCIG